MWDGSTRWSGKLFLMLFYCHFLQFIFYWYFDWIIILTVCAFVSFTQIKVPHPSYPSTLISIQVPKLGFHFSPTRYRRLTDLLNILNDAMEPCGQHAVDNLQAQLTPWSSADLATDAKILVWRVCSLYERNQIFLFFSISHSLVDNFNTILNTTLFNILRKFRG